MIDLTQLSDEEINREYWRRVRIRRVSNGRPRVLRPCPFCAASFGADELRAHKPHCPAKYAAKLNKIEESTK